MAVGLVLLLFEAAFAQRLQAEVAHEVVGVEFGPHGSDAASQDGLLTGLTHAPAGLVVVGLTQGLALVFEEAAVHKGSVALLQDGRGGERSEVGRRVTSFWVAQNNRFSNDLGLSSTVDDIAKCVTKQ